MVHFWVCHPCKLSNLLCVCAHKCGLEWSPGIFRRHFISIPSDSRKNFCFDSIGGPEGYDYSLKNETSIDRFFKFVGLANEYQTGNKDFDDLVYVVSDNSKLHQQISLNHKITDSVVEIFKAGKNYKYKVKEIRNNSGRLWVKMRYRTYGGFDKKNVPVQSAEIARLLKVIAGEIEQKKWPP